MRPSAKIGPAQSSPKALRRAPRPPRGRRAFAVLAVILLGISSVVLGAYTIAERADPRPPAHGLAAAPAGSDAIEALAPILAGMRGGAMGELSMSDLFGPAFDILLEPGTDPPRARSPPSDIAQLLDRLQIPHWQRRPIPAAPEGPEPLLSALRSLSGQLGVDLPAEEALRLEIVALRLQPAAEQALARLVLAYEEALRLEDRALAGLTPFERRLLDQDPDAVWQWLDQDPSRGAEDFTSYLQTLSTERVNLGDRVAAADLLVRTAQDVRDELALPAAPWDEVPASAHDTRAPHARASAPAAASPVAATTRPPSAAPPNPDLEPVLRLAHSIVSPSSAHPTTALPEVPRESLSESIRELAWLLGYPPEPIALPETDLPLSLSNAIAGIVTARRIGLETGNPSVHSALLVQAIQEAEPTLRAWAAVLELEDALDPTPLLADPSAAVATLLAAPAAATPSSLLDGPHGQPSARDANTLESLLQQRGASPMEAQAASASLPPPVALAAAMVLDATESLRRQTDAAFASLNPGQAALLSQTPDVLALLQRPQWNMQQASLVEDWAEAMQAFTTSGELAAIQNAQTQALSAIEAAAQILTDAAAPLLPGVSMPMAVTAAGPVPCPTASPLARCDQDVWLFAPGILVTGFGETQIDAAYGAPVLIIDMGGDDSYLLSAGGGAPGSPAVVFDTGGSELYRSDAQVAQGAAEGIGALGVLWDLAGDDTYEHRPSAPAVSYAQGAGAAGGLGVLVDDGGSDTYDARRSDAHGSGWGSPVGGSGILLDRGPGGDTFLADRGQGYGAGPGSLGALINLEGVAAYTTTKGNPRHQGGAAPGVAAIGLLVDLGGRLTSYSNPILADTATLVSHPAHPRERSDDALWFERTNPMGFGLGIDSTGSDDDDDSFPNLIELAARSDPQDGSESGQPGLGALGGVESILAGLIGEPPEPGDLLDDPTSFLEGAGFADGLLCRDGDSPCTETMSILQINGTADDKITRTAHILIDLGGDDVYTNEVAGPAHFWVGGQPHHGLGSIAIDVLGDDVYDTPDLDWTQGAIELYAPGLTGGSPPLPPNDPSFVQCGTSVTGLSVGEACQRALGVLQEWAGVLSVWGTDAALNAGSTRSLAPVSLLFNANGTDEYRARAHSQGAVGAETPSCLTVAQTSPTPSGAAWLIDGAGDDTYVGGAFSQASARADAGIAGFVDAAGDDQYTFASQARSEQEVEGACARRVALLIDGGGTDEYNSTFLAVNTVGLSKAAPDKAFESQGFAAGNPSGASGAGLGASLFMDNGETLDRHVTLNTTGEFVDISDVKNDEVRRNGLAGGAYSDGTLWFTDPAAAEDPDRDGAPSIIERLFTSKPRDPQDNAGDAWHAPERLQESAETPTDLTPEEVQEAAGLDAAGIWLRWPGVLAVGGRGDKILHEAFPLIVSLGGNNSYFGPNLGGTRTSGVSLVWDTGAGNTTFEPTATTCAVTAPVAATTSACPSLGGAQSGVAILIDDGGRNQFRTIATLDLLDQGVRNYELLAQGAAANNAVGILLTRNANDTFEATLTADVRQQPGGTALSVNLQGTVQGAGRGGIGILASLGTGSDQFALALHSDGPATNRSYAQGAGIGAGGVGVLVDQGGDNTYRAPWGFAQGFGDAGLGILFTGTGRDALIGGPFGQGVGAHPNGVGLLQDAGGGDDYQAIPNVDEAAYVQGAAFAEGAGLLFDVGGDDRYIAPALERSQGAAVAADAALLDLGGHDIYRAASFAQGYVRPDVAVSDQPQASALFIDLHGDDVYDLASGLGQGAGDPQCATGAWPALFLDSQGADIYRYAGTKNEVPGQPRNPDDNNWAWTQPATPVQNCPFGVGLDARALDDALTVARSAGLTVGVQGVTMEAWSDDERLTDNERVSGDILLRAFVRMNPPDPELVDRVSFVGDAGRIGEAEFIGAEALGLRYDFLWRTAALVQDDDFRINAAVFTRAAAAGSDTQARPDAPSVASTPLRLRIDNPPGLFAELLAPSPMIAPTKSPSLPLRVILGPDFAQPLGTSAEPSCDADAEPGGFLTIRLRNTVREYIEFEGYCDAGTFTFPLDGLDANQKPWKDGTYDLVVELKDAQDQTSTVGPPILDPIVVDTRPPRSAISIVDYANRQHRGSAGSTLALPWEYSDFGGSGVAEVCIFQLDAQGLRVPNPLGDECVENPLDPPSPLQVPGVETGDRFRFVAVGADVLGNTESPCESRVDEQPDSLCYLRKADDLANIQEIEIDFTEPVVSQVRVSGQDPSLVFAKPGTPLNFTAEVADEGSGIAGVIIELPGLATQVMETDGAGNYWYDEWHLHNADLLEGEEREESYAFTISTLDLAGNPRAETFASTLDSLGPRIEALETRYREPGAQGAPLAAGRAGAEAIVRARVQEAGSLELEVDTTAVAASAATDCVRLTSSQEASFWECVVPLRSNVADGVYELPFRAADAAANPNLPSTATLVVRGQPLDLQGVHVASVAHDRFRINWTTPFPGTSRLEYGRTASLGQAVDEDEFTTTHSVEVIDLSPATLYHFRVSSTSQGGRLSQGSGLTVTTNNSFQLRFVEFPEGAPRQGDARFELQLDAVGDAPVAAIVRLRDVGRNASPIDVGSTSLSPGASNITVNTTLFADGTYELVLQLDRPTDGALVASPLFFIDNTDPVILLQSPAPGARTGQTRPLFEMVLMDPAGREPPPLAGLGIEQAGAPLAYVVMRDEVVGPASVQRTIAVRPSADLAEGTHRVNLTLRDGAGNSVVQSLQFHVDTSPPTLAQASAKASPGPRLARPGGYAQITAHVTDVAGVASVRLDLSPLGQPPLPMLLSDGQWKADIAIPLTVPTGTYDLVIRATDALGAAGEAGRLGLVVDADAPEVTSSAVTHIDYVGATVTVVANEPIHAWLARDPTPDLSRLGPAASTQSINVSGIEPGSNQLVFLRLLDEAGNALDHGFRFTSQDDREPPRFANNSLRATSTAEGRVELEWSAAQDNAGLLHYLLERDAAPRDPGQEFIVAPNATRFEDAQAPAGRNVTYRLIPIDIAGLRGVPLDVRVLVHAQARLELLSLSPASGPASLPFTLRVQYHHPGGAAPDRVVARIADAEYELTPAPTSRPCHKGCSFEAQVFLPASSLRTAETRLLVQASLDADVQTLDVDPLPFVTSADPEPAKARGTSPTTAGIGLVFVWLACAVVLRRARRDP